MALEYVLSLHSQLFAYLDLRSLRPNDADRLHSIYSTRVSNGSSRPKHQENAATQTPKLSSSALFRASNAPEYHGYDGPPSTLAEYQYHSQRLSLDQHPSTLSDEVSSTVSYQTRIVRSSSRDDPLDERPEKRLKLDRRTSSNKEDISLFVPVSLQTHQHEYSFPMAQRRRSISPPHAISPTRNVNPGCKTCKESEESIMVVVKNLMDLQNEVSKILQRNRRYESFHEVTKHGIKHALEWTAQEIQTTTQLLQNVSTTTKIGLPSLADVAPDTRSSEIRRASLSGQSPSIATSIHDPRPLATISESSKAEDYHGRSKQRYKDSLPPIILPDETRRPLLFEQMPLGAAQSPHPSSAGSVLGSAPSPMASQFSSRALPSPPSTHYPPSTMSGPAHFSPKLGSAAHASHLQDLQHQISTKTLALQTLQREHDQLLAAFSRSQIRCNTLDKKSQVSDHEIQRLTEEKIRLQQQVDALESQVEELLRRREEYTKQSSADGAQWRQIMAMSSQLQLKGADDMKRYKQDREAWDRDRAALEQRIKELESGKSPPSATMQLLRVGSTEEADEILESTSVDVLRQEVVRLRHKCGELELTLQDISGEADQINSALAMMASMRQRIASKRRRDESS